MGRGPTAPGVAILEIFGQIGVQARAQEMVRAIKALREDRRVLAVLVDVDSPRWTKAGGDSGTRTRNLCHAKAALSQLSYIPTCFDYR